MQVRAMSAEATGWTWTHSPYSGAQLLVHLAIADVVNDLHDHKFWMSTETLARKAKVSRSTVVATLSDMVERGLIVVVESGGGSRKPSVYQWTAGPLARSGSPLARSALVPLARSPRTNSIEEPNERGASQLKSAQELRAELDNDRAHAVPPPKRDKSKPLTALAGKLERAPI